MTERKAPFVQSLQDRQPRLTATIARIKERGGKVDPRLVPKSGDYRSFSFEPSELSTVPLEPLEFDTEAEFETEDEFEPEKKYSSPVVSMIVAGITLLSVVGGGLYVYRRTRRT